MTKLTILLAKLKVRVSTRVVKCPEEVISYLPSSQSSRGSIRAFPSAGSLSLGRRKPVVLIVDQSSPRQRVFDVKEPRQVTPRSVVIHRIAEPFQQALHVVRPRAKIPVAIRRVREIQAGGSFAANPPSGAEVRGRPLRANSSSVIHAEGFGARHRSSVSTLSPRRSSPSPPQEAHEGLAEVDAFQPRRPAPRPPSPLSRPASPLLAPAFPLGRLSSDVSRG